MTERGVFDLRLHVEGEDRLDVWARVTAFQRAARLLAGSGVTVRYVQLREPRSRDFAATMAPTPKRRKRAA